MAKTQEEILQQIKKDIEATAKEYFGKKIDIEIDKKVFIDSVIGYFNKLKALNIIKDECYVKKTKLPRKLKKRYKKMGVFSLDVSFTMVDECNLAEVSLDV